MQKNTRTYIVKSKFTLEYQHEAPGSHADGLPVVHLPVDSDRKLKAKPYAKYI